MDRRVESYAQPTELRFDALFTVLLTSEEFGEQRCIARNISKNGIFIECRDVLPLGARVQVHFLMQDGQGEIVARAVVKNHYFLSYSGRSAVKRLVGMGLKFLGFENNEEHVDTFLRSGRIH